MRVIAGGSAGGSRRRAAAGRPAPDAAANGALYVVVDRLTAGGVEPSRGSAIRSKRPSPRAAAAATRSSPTRRLPTPSAPTGRASAHDRSTAGRGGGSASARSWPARTAGSSIPTPEPRLYSFNSPLGACPECEGFGNVIDIDMDLVVPDRDKSIREGAIAPWNSPAYAHELEELLALADDYDMPVDVPFSRARRAARAADRRRRARSGSSAAWTASSPGWSGGSTRCTSACS